ncbi:MAG: rod shape-determining protein RodA [Lachnospiraceae bacterium]|nr:rod shape-determining protein RodA [Lachnospiraceae bacterium]
MLRTYKFKNYNFMLCFFVIALSVIGYLAIGSAKESVQSRQLYGIFVGVAAMIIISFINYDLYGKVKWFIYGINIVLLIMVLVAGVNVNGSTRWINIGFQFQPSELAKIMLILFFSQFIMEVREKLNSLPMIGILCALMLVPLLLVFKEPDLSTSIMIVITFCIMIFIGGLNYKTVILVLATVIPIVIGGLVFILNEKNTILEGYQVLRIRAWLDPEKYADAEAYQQINSITAIGSGQLFGKGLNNNVIASVKNGNFISEPQTDFIFAVIGEELGFIGSAAVIILLLLIAIECFIIAHRSKDLSGAIIADAVGCLICIQGFMNIAVATGLLPNTGIPLPFVSYGLTSLVSLYMGIGVVLNVGLQGSKRKNTTDFFGG